MARKGQECEPVDLHSYFQAMMTNIVAETVLDYPRQLVSYDAPTSRWMAVHHFISRYRWLIGDIPWLVPIGLGLLKVFPDWIGAISDGFKDLYEHCKIVGNEILTTRKINDRTLSSAKRQSVLLLEHHDHIQELTRNNTSELLQQAAVFLLAGTSPSITLTVACFYILKLAHIREQLRNELDSLERRTLDVSAPQFDWRELSRLRYLTRISAAHFVFHHNENIFPEPGHFDPERWLHKSTEELQTMEQYFMPFSKGSRACIGWQQAYVYMFTAIAYILTRFEMKLIGNPPDNLNWKDQTGAVPVAPPLVWLRSRNRT
ncbi:cytochrome P450 [Aspergillus ruber CBS 135680]|uniref:Cytochrome P450 n=1 Tax=Aspergillus ruber (strain CBS 135680) TaxID=1388766 RepID=A0A017S301_ASPRC|nr:cytochrome P450 [Aspergillus ruber CBS 135680]EYE91408.1 cytochrome P450 [Aspergillus ruber CBS 135680]